MLMTALLLLAVTALVLLVLRTARASSRLTVDRWAAAHGLALTDRNRPMVGHYLRTAGQLRFLGGAFGLVLPVPLSAALGGDTTSVPGGWTWVIVGYLLGALYAEVALGRPLGPAGRGASLVPRELESYRPAVLGRAQRLAGLASGVLGCTVAAVGFSRAEAVGLGHLSTSGALVLGGLGVAFALVLEVVQRWIVVRPQPLVPTDLLEADDAIRAQSVATIAGAGIAILLLLVGKLLWQLALSDVQLFRWTAWVPAIGCWVFALVAWLRFGHLPWRVTRTRSLRPVEVG